MKKFKPNAKLPKGGKQLFPFEKKIGSWVAQTFDACVERRGVTWYRVHYGMNGANNREDWIADIPYGCLSVHDYHWTGPRFGPRYRSFEAALDGQARSFVSWLTEDLKKQQAKLADIEQALRKFSP